MRKKFLICIILLIIVAVSAYPAYRLYLYIKYPPCASQNGFNTLKGGKPFVFNFSTKYKYVFIQLEADAAPAEKPVKYYIVNPAGTILDKGQFDKDGHLKIDKKYPGAKGDWQIKFDVSDSNEVIQCHYTFASADSVRAFLNR